MTSILSLQSLRLQLLESLAAFVAVTRVLLLMADRHRRTDIRARLKPSMAQLTNAGSLTPRLSD